MVNVEHVSDVVLMLTDCSQQRFSLCVRLVLADVTVVVYAPCGPGAVPSLSLMPSLPHFLLLAFSICLFSLSY